MNADVVIGLLDLVLAAGHHGERLRRWFQFAVAD